MFMLLGIICVGCLAQVCFAELDALKGPALVEKDPKLSNSYIPAAMQIIAHDTELMKYVIKPPQGTTTTTTSTMRPTPPHPPGLVAPSRPLGPSVYFAKRNIRPDYVQFQQQPVGANYFDRYSAFLSPEYHRGRQLQDQKNIYDQAEEYFGKGFGDVLKLANRIDTDFEPRNEENQVLEFSKDFEDSDSTYRFEVLREKRVPPTKAYVTMLSLYDVLNKESKRLMLNKFAGYTEEVLNNLIDFSSSTSSRQLRSTLKKVVDNGNSRKSDVLMKINALIADLDEEGSYINKALADIPPLVFAV